MRPPALAGVPRGLASAHVRLRDRRGRLGRLRACEPAHRGPGRLGPPDRGRRPGHERAGPPPRGLLGAVPQRAGLGPLDDLRAVRERPARVPPARARCWAARRRSTRSSTSAATRSTTTAGGPAGRGTRCSPTSSAPRTTSAARASSTGPAGRCRCPRGARATRSRRTSSTRAPSLGLPANEDFNDGVAGRDRLVPGDRAERRPLQHRGRLPAPGDEPPEPDRRDARARAVDPVRGRARRRRGGRAAVRDGREPRRARGDRVLRHLQHAAAPDAVRHRARRPSSQELQIEVGGRVARDGAQPARPPEHAARSGGSTRRSRCSAR